jgi:hypothetical protein
MHPRISKSWLQVKIIFFCYRRDLFQELRQKFLQNKEDEGVVGLSIKKARNDSNREVMQRPDADNEVLSIDKEMNKSKVKKDLWWPKIIVRTIEGTVSWCFSPAAEPNTVMEVTTHLPSTLRLFTNANTMLLWEPGHGTAAILYNDICGRIVATLSPESQDIVSKR